MALFNSLQGYPVALGGSKSLALAPNGHAGPASYVQYLNGAGTGDVLQVAEFGLLWFDHVEGGYSSDGLYIVQPVNPTAGPAKTIPLIWIDALTGLEVAALTNLAGSKVNLKAIGM